MSELTGAGEILCDETENVEESGAGVIVERCWVAEVGGWCHKAGDCRRTEMRRREDGRMLRRTLGTKRMSPEACTLARRCPRCWPRQGPCTLSHCQWSLVMTMVATDQGTLLHCRHCHSLPWPPHPCHGS